MNATFCITLMLWLDRRKALGLKSSLGVASLIWSNCEKISSLETKI